MKHLLIILFALCLSLLAAQNAPYYPTTTLIENFGASWCLACEVAQQGLDVISSEVQASEIIVPRLLTESGDYSFPEMDERFSYYEVLGFPAVIFNGKIRVNGSDEPIADGSLYRDALNQFRYLASPIKMAVQSANHASGDYSFRVSMLHPGQSIEDAAIRFYLVEKSVTEDLDDIVRNVQSQPITISGEGTNLDFNFNVSPDPAWNTANLWALAFVQASNKTVLQAISTQPAPENQIRVAVPFDIDIRVLEPGSFFSPLFYVYKMGTAGTISTVVEPVDLPEDWFVNYCDVDGFCYPGGTVYEHEMGANEAKAFDLNVYTGSEGVGLFNFVISSTDAETYRIPFRMSVGNVSNQDPTSAPAAISVTSAWPNPFQNAVKFDLQSAKAGVSTELGIFNSRGQKVANIPLHNLQQGINQVSWDATDLPNGIYFYRLKNSNISGKLLRLR